MLGGYKKAWYAKKYGNNREVFNTGKELYVELKEEEILGYFVDEIINEKNLSGASARSTENKRMEETPLPKRKQQDIRTPSARKKTNTKKNQDIIEIID